MRSSQTIMVKGPGNPKLGPRFHLFSFTYLVSCLYLLGGFPVAVHSSSPPIHEGALASDNQALWGSSSLGTRPVSEKASSSTPLVSLLVSATSSSSASVPTSLAASSSTLGLLASSTDQELDNETISEPPETKTELPDTTDDANGVQNKGEVLPGNIPKSGSGRIMAKKSGYRCENVTGKCDSPLRGSSLDKDPEKNKPASAATTKTVLKDEGTDSSDSSTNIEPSTAQPLSSTTEKLASSSLVQSTIIATNGTSSIIGSSSTSSQTTTKTTTAANTTSTTIMTTVVPPKITNKGTTAIPTEPIPSPSPTPRDYLYNNPADISDYSEYNDARFAEERRRDENASAIFRDHSREIGDDLDLYDMERDINPTEGAAFERTRPNRNMTSGTKMLGNSNQDSSLHANLTGKYNLTNKQIFFPEHFPLRKMKHRTWFAQQHRLGRHALDPIDDGPFSSLIWKDKKYLISVLVPIGVGIAGAVVFVVAAYATRSCRGTPHTFVPTVGTDLFLQHVHSRNDDIFLLMETTDDEM